MNDDPASPIPFHPAWWLPGPHLPTLWAALVRRRIALDIAPERIELPDGDFVDLAWHRVASPRGLVLLLHGLEGGIESPYIRGQLSALGAAGFSSVVLQFRGCSGEANRLHRNYHSGETGDPRFIVELLGKREPALPLFAVGYSLGGNVLLKLLAEYGEASPLRAAVAVSVPFDLAACATKLASGFSRVYQSHLLRRLKTRLRGKYGKGHAVVDVDLFGQLRDFHAFDHHVTAPLHGFASGAEYYQRSSCRQYLPAIRTSTLLIHARNDPFVAIDSIPATKELPPQVRLELTSQGGHVGFVTGLLPLHAGYWLEQRIPQFFLGAL
ncbi:MAG: hydrolase [Gammaproteobacteria bacterium]|nr:hydrolase [Gammaproteobacteria bacterium]